MAIFIGRRARRHPQARGEPPFSLYREHGI